MHPQPQVLTTPVISNTPVTSPEAKAEEEPSGAGAGDAAPAGNSDLSN